MTTKSLLLLIMAAGVCLSGMVSDANAFRVNQPGPNWRVVPSVHPPIMHWDLREFPDCRIPYTINPNCGDLGNEVNLIDAAVATWNNVDPMVTTLYRHPTATTRTTRANDDESILYWDANPSGTWLGTTALFPWPFPSTGVIEEGDIAFNDRYFTWGDDSAQNFTHRLAVAGGAGPFNLAAVLAQPGPHLVVTLNGTDVRSITFDAMDFPNPAAATRNEASAAINWHIGAATPAFTPRAGIAFPAEGSVLLLASHARHPGGSKVRTIQVGGPAAAVLGFPAGVFTVSNVDVQTVALHELGHYLGLADLYGNTTRHGGAEVMLGLAPKLSARRALHADDEDGVNFLHTPEIGDAPDPDYPSLVHGAPNAARVLNGVTLLHPGAGAEVIFGLMPKQAGREYLYEWIGTVADGECESDQVDQDIPSDDGVRVEPFPLLPCEEFTIYTTIDTTHDAMGGVHDLASHPLYLNIWVDLNQDGDWDDAGEHVEGYDTAIRAAQTRMTTATMPCATNGRTWMRVRLDWDEDSGHHARIDPALNGPRGAAQFGEVEDYPLDVGPASTPVELTSLSITSRDRHVLLSWTTASETSNLGFNIHRALAENARRVRINGEMILAAPRGDGHTSYTFVDRDVVGAVDYFYWLEDIDHRGESTMHGPVSAAGPATTGSPLAAVVSLAPNDPNPFRTETSIRYSLPAESNVVLSIYGVSGRRIRTIVNERQPAGWKIAHWDGLNEGGAEVSAGVYFYRLEAGGRVEVRKMIYLK